MRVTDAYRSIDIRELPINRLLRIRSSFSKRWVSGPKVIAELQATVREESAYFRYVSQCSDSTDRSFDFTVKIERTTCHYGGSRTWFRCPMAVCNRRVAVLYLDGVFACRRCHTLSYRTQRLGWLERILRNMETTKSRLGWHEGGNTVPGDRPKGMHVRTFERIRSKHEYFDSLATQHFRSLLAKTVVDRPQNATH